MRWGAIQSGQLGFTLIEVLVSLLILAVMSATAWKGMDGITKGTRGGRWQSSKQTFAFAVGDDAVGGGLVGRDGYRVVPAWQFDGANVRMTRKTGARAQMVVWSLRNGQWVRWASAATTMVGDLQQQWMRSFQLQGKEPGNWWPSRVWSSGRCIATRNGNWSNCQSSNDVASAGQCGGAIGRGYGRLLWRRRPRGAAANHSGGVTLEGRAVVFGGGHA